MEYLKDPGPFGPASRRMTIMTDPLHTPPHAPNVGDIALTRDHHRVEIFSQARLPTAYGEFAIVAFKNSKDPHEHIALYRGEPWGQSAVPTRLHSECLTGDVFGSLKCDCGEQLHVAMEQLARSPVGILLYMRQEGRGIGLANKIRAYALQDQGLDTVEANRHLGFDDDIREYDIAAAMLQLLRPASITLFTNNPAKIGGLADHGVLVQARLAIHVVANEHNELYLETKRKKSGHWL